MGGEGKEEVCEFSDWMFGFADEFHSEGFFVESRLSVKEGERVV
jgi:hypothetical protein